MTGSRVKQKMKGSQVRLTVKGRGAWYRSSHHKTPV